MKTLIKKLKALRIYTVRFCCFFGFHNWKQYDEKPMKLLKNSTMYYDKCKNCECKRDYFIMW